MSSRTPRTGTPLAVKAGWRTFVSVIEKTLPALVLLVLLTYSYVYIVQLPYVGFDWQPNGLVISLYVDAPQEASGTRGRAEVERVWPAVATTGKEG